MREFKFIVKELRKQKKLSQQELADNIGTSKSTIAMWETGRRLPSKELYDALADYFNVDIDYLYGRTSIPKKISYDQNGIEYIVNIPNNQYSEIELSVPDNTNRIERLLKYFSFLNNYDLDKVENYVQFLVYENKNKSEQ